MLSRHLASTQLDAFHMKMRFYLILRDANQYGMIYDAGDFLYVNRAHAIDGRTIGLIIRAAFRIAFLRSAESDRWSEPTR